MLWIRLGLLFAGVISAQTECASCHAGQVAAHRKTNHANSLRPPVSTEFFQSLPGRPIGEARGGFLLEYARQGTSLVVTSSRNEEQSSALIEWAFGAGDQGITPVARAGGRWIEHRISYYPKAGRFDLTLGHKPGASSSAGTAIGIEQAPETIRACFGCHSSASDSLKEVRPGVACERCHAGASGHARGESRMAPFPRRDAQVQMRICGECHRTSPPDGNPDNPLNVRFQPLRLMKSKCFLKGDLGCVTCHPAHENAIRGDAAFYRARCLSCHAGQSTKGDCVGCHMPVSTPAPYLSFTDHFIR
jgi:hypothetical protein